LLYYLYKIWAGFYEEEDEQEPGAFERFLLNVFGERAEKIVMGVTVAFSIVMAVGIFMVLPYFISGFFRDYIVSNTLLAILEGAIRLGLFVLYVVLISSMKDIKRVYMYHGAEHKCINCIERGRELNVKNVRKSSRYHSRCGTSFLFIVMVISIVFFIFIRVESPALRVLFRLLLIPVIAGVSYEFIRLAGRSENVLVRILSLPGKGMQMLTTKEPDDGMIEVAMAAGGHSRGIGWTTGTKKRIRKPGVKNDAGGAVPGRKERTSGGRSGRVGAGCLVSAGIRCRMYKKQLLYAF
jgi:uncharacterized protein YqhQ